MDETHAFIVRIWFEMLDQSDSNTWRGSIEQVGSENRVYFQDLEKISDFIQEKLGVIHTSAPDGSNVSSTQPDSMKE